MSDNGPKVNILFQFIEGPWGGGNQFLKALWSYFKKTKIYSERAEDAQVIFFNGYPFNSEYLFDSIINLKKKEPGRIVVHRVDGPISYIRGRDRIIDGIVSKFNRYFVDGTIFQSNWCMKHNKEGFAIDSNYETVIYNAPDNEIFNRTGKAQLNSRKVKLIASSWSSNWRKGFKVYQFLDENLDFSKYELTFIGNSPIDFQNIKQMKPVPNIELARILKEHDIFITASQSDPCSNSLIEALSCGLPAVVLNDGGHPELVGGGGELFNGSADILGQITKVAHNYSHYQSHIPEFSKNQAAQSYYDFARTIISDVEKGLYRPKVVNTQATVILYYLKFMILFWKCSNKLRAITNRHANK
jgi:glycosyltransferase involved in cell wall biosynthesis